MSADERAAIEHLVRAYVALSAGLRFAEKRAYWDEDEPSPVLAPEEAATPLVGWDAIERYWSGSRESIADLRTECFDVHVNLLAPDLAVRATFALRKRPAGWRIFASVEAHVDGAEYFRSLYRQRARS